MMQSVVFLIFFALSFCCDNKKQNPTERVVFLLWKRLCFFFLFDVIAGCFKNC